ncbi:MAG TPA: tetratricopeptide repeat protein [Candidatus Brocadiaceae bacterium]|nr:tetratricopeptide repeat protein [Candidatus Brocadiaceae bacterium]
MNTKTIVSILVASLVPAVAGCSSDRWSLKELSPFKKEEAQLESRSGKRSSDTVQAESIFVCAGDIDVAYKKMGEVNIAEFGFSGADVLAAKIREKARDGDADAVINVQYDTGASKTWNGYGETGGTDYGVKHTTWCKGMAVEFVEAHNALGLLVCSVTRENRDWFSLKKSQNGVFVVSVLPGSAAETAGLKVEDLITEWNTEKIENKVYFRRKAETDSTKEVKLTLVRAKDIKTVTVLMPKHEVVKVEAPAEKSPPQPPSPQQPPTPPPPKPTEYEMPVTSQAKTATPSQATPKTAGVYNEIGDLYLRKGMYDEALAEYKNAISVDPDCAISHFNLSIVYEKKGMQAEADEEYATYKRLKQKKQ